VMNSNGSASAGVATGGGGMTLLITRAGVGAAAGSSSSDEASDEASGVSLSGVVVVSTMPRCGCGTVHQHPFPWHAQTRHAAVLDIRYTTKQCPSARASSVIEPVVLVEPLRPVEETLSASCHHRGRLFRQSSKGEDDGTRDLDSRLER
jgi:hypothetical protein